MSDNDMIHKEDIYAAFGKTMPEETQVDDSSVDPFVDIEEINNSHAELDSASIDTLLDSGSGQE